MFLDIEKECIHLKNIFSKNYFFDGEDRDTLCKNLLIAEDKYQHASEQLEEVNQRINNNLEIDISAAILSVQIQCIADYFRKELQEKIKKEDEQCVEDSR